jgi:hypothetical protein
MKKIISQGAAICAVSSLLLLPACDWFKSKTSQMTGSPAEGEVLMTIKGKAALTVPEFEAYYEQLLEQQPQLKSFAAFMPDLKKNIFDTLSSQKTLEQWVVNEGINDRAEYQADRKALLENVDRGLAIKYFQEKHPVKVTDNDIQDFYKKNKDTVYLMSPSGVNAVGVSFDKEDAAKAFLVRAQQKGADINKLASDSKVTVRQWGRVNDENQQVDKALKAKIVAMKGFPSTQMFKVDKTYWVVQAKSKDEAKHYPFEQAKDDARNRLEQERMGQVFNTEIAKLKKEFNVVENATYFEAKKEEGPSSQVVASKQATAAAPAPKAIAKA